MSDFETDYLVVGAGATGMAFVDTLLDETDAHITIVDRRDRPGGHWNDTYPFVRLHQPASYYGVASTDLGQARIDQNGTNKGYEELASAPEINGYFQSVMKDRFLASGRVNFLPMTEHRGGGDLRHVLSDKAMSVNVRKRVIDARVCENGIPLTHQRKFDVAEGVTCIPPNFLPHHAKDHQHFMILGAGKTGMDSVVWLLESGAQPDQIGWVVPRDPWTINRGFSQPSGAFYQENMGGMARQMQAVVDAGSVDELALGMEEAGIWMRLDPNVTPQIMHGPTLSRAELQRLQEVPDIIRMGHVQSIESDRMTLAQGTRRAKPGTLYIDCTARALGHSNTWPIFTDERVGLQMVRLYQPTFSAALLARIEAMSMNDKAKNALAQPVPMTDDVQSWIRSQIVTLMNQNAWSQVPELRDWIKSCRLDGFGRPSREVDRDDPANRALFEQVRNLSMPAFANMQKLAAA
ncbi:MAG: NAD(P)-binding protein [Pseudomonadota bacterium]